MFYPPGEEGGGSGCTTDTVVETAARPPEGVTSSIGQAAGNLKRLRHTGPMTLASQEIPERTETGLSRRLVLLMAACTGLSVASNYYAQPLLAAIRRSLHMSTGTAGLVVSLTQVGYVLGLVLLVPLGDLLSRRRLIPLMVAGVAASLALVAGSPSAVVLLVASVAVGSLSVAAQITVAFSASLASDASRGRVVGTVMSGLLLGILLARTAAGYIAEAGGWRAPFAAAAAVMIVLSIVLSKQLPTDRPAQSSGYLRTIASVPRLLREEPIIRTRALYGAAAFGAFSALWTPLAFLLSGPPYRYATSTIGLFGLFGVVGAATASFAGRLADRGRAPLMTAVTSLVLLGAWAPIALGRHSLWALIVGVIVVDFAAQGLHITNQSQIYKLRPEARSRITSAYMSVYFVGGVAGSVASATAYSAAGWEAVSLVGAAFGVAAVGLLAIYRGSR